MPWYEPGGVWAARAAITLYSSSDLAQDFDVIIPPGWDDFWTNIDTSGDELRVTNPLGTLLDYDVDDGSGGAFDKTNREGRIRINDYDTPVSTSGATLAFLYYKSTSAQGSAAGTAGAGGQTGYIDLSLPSGDVVLNHRGPRPGATLPPFSMHKTAAERKDAWIRYPLALSHTPVNSANQADELYYVTTEVLDTAGASVGSMSDTDEIRFVWIARGPFAGQWVRVPVIAGTTGTNYTLSVVARLVNKATGIALARSQLDTRVAIYCRDVRLTS